MGASTTFTPASPTVPALVDPRYTHEVRWRPGERLDQLFEARVDGLREEGHPDRIAVDAGDDVLTYEELDARANQLARILAARGVRPGDRVGLLFDRAVPAYEAMLATIKLQAAYVPLDKGFPSDRLAYICADADVRTVVTVSRLRELLELVDAQVFCVDENLDLIRGASRERLSPREKGVAVDELAYVIYTSGSTGRPKGVAIDHPSICNFVRVAAEVYGVRGDDRIYQGMTIAFDFSVEEIWVPWMVGATLVPKPDAAALLGHELREFLVEQRITALCCVPTLLATMEQDVASLRFLLVSGEACPQDLIARWSRPGRRFLNVYGPTEATVTATWTVLEPDRRVTIGVPLPTYSVVMLQPDADVLVPPGEVGEICLAGICLARGYLNRPDLTERAFIPDTHQIPNNPSGRLYRTGDLGRIDEYGEIEYLGRIDLQVKIRGYRIELTEIESVLLQFPGIATAVVEPWRPEPGVVELVAYYSRRSDAAAIDPVEVQQAMRDVLPGYMVPAYFEELDVFPLLPSDKVDRKKLPPPSPERRLGGSEEYIEPEGPLETAFAEILAEVLRVERVSATAHFFDDLGANSLLLARFCARVRERADLPAPVMKHIYRHPTIRLLAGSFAASADAGAVSGPDGARPDAPAARTASVVAPVVHRAKTWAYAATGVAQLAVFAAYCYLAASLIALQVDWLAAAANPWDLHTRLVGFSASIFGFLLVFPVAAKWILIGRWKQQQIPVWGLAYLRFWTVRMLVQMNPIKALAGTPVFPLYLRLLGARVGRRVCIQSGDVPACPDLLTIGSDTVICKGASYHCYRAEGGIIQTGRVTIGERAFAGEQSVFDIDTSLGDDSQLGHGSALIRGQEVPGGQRWHGCPAEPTDSDYHRVPAAKLPAYRTFAYGLFVLLFPIVIGMPVATAFFLFLVQLVPDVATLLVGVGTLPWNDWSTYVVGIIITLDLYLLGLAVRFVLTLTVPRVLNLFLRPGTVYRLYGFHYWCLRTVRRMTNGGFIPMLGDSSYITGFLTLLGYRLKPLVQTGTNFGMVVSHDNPFLVTIGRGSMVSDGLDMVHAEYSSTSFRVRPTRIGTGTFVGNGIIYTPDAKVGDNCLLATKVLVPVDGEVRHDVGLLGSPAFEIPRAVERDRGFDELKSGDVLRQALSAKLRYNTGTILLFLLNHWIVLCLGSVLLVLAIDVMPQFGTWAVALSLFLMPVIFTLQSIFVERATLGFRKLQPLYCSIYDPAFWRHERYWKLSGGPAGMFLGTPFVSWVWRSLGVRVGRRLFDDGCGIVEKSLLTIGDDCTLNAGGCIQGHSLEEGTFKSDRIILGDGCTVGTIAFVHYGVRVGNGSVIEADSFVMKGEDVPAGQRWQGNPAFPVSEVLVAVEAPSAPEPTHGTPPVGVAPEQHQSLKAGALVAEAVPAAQGETVVEGEVTEEPGATWLLRTLRADGGPQLGERSGVSVHLFSLEACRLHEERLTALLGWSDQAQAAALGSPERRLQFVSSRALVALQAEAEFGGRLDAGPPDESGELRWWLSTEPGGRPVLHGPVALSVSLSYTSELLAVALSTLYEVGIDVVADQDAEVVPLWALTKSERWSLTHPTKAARRHAFLRMWSLKEAAAKCLGVGSAMDFGELDTLTGVDGRAEGRLAGMWFHEAVWGEGQHRHWLAVAAQRIEQEAADSAAV